MKTIHEYLISDTDSNQTIETPVNEMLLSLMLGMALLGYGFAPAIKALASGPIKWLSDSIQNWWDTDNDKKDDDDEEDDYKKINNKKINNITNDKSDDDKSDDDKSDDDKSDDEKKDDEDPAVKAIGILNNLKSESTEDSESLNYYKDLLIASTYDKDGNLIPADKRQETMKSLLPEGSSIDDITKNLDNFVKQINSEENQAKFKDMLKEVDPTKAKASIDDIKTSSAKLWEQKEKTGQLNDKEDDYLKRMNEIASKISKSQNDSEKDDSEKDDPDSKQNQETVKDEEVEDPQTGKKIKVAVHTGPRGGRWYLSQSGGKVYIESLREHIQNKLME